MNTAADITNERCVVCWGIEHKHHFAQLTLGTIATAAFIAAQMSGGGATRNGVTAENALIGLNLNALHLEGTTTTTEQLNYERPVPKPSRAKRIVNYGAGILNKIMMCESGGNPTIQNGHSTASGLFQYLDSTWNNWKGYARAMFAPAAIQWERARYDYARVGTTPWNASRHCWAA